MGGGQPIITSKKRSVYRCKKIKSRAYIILMKKVK